MLHDRVAVIVQYLSAVSTGAAPQHDETLRHISALVSSLQPTTTLTDDDGPSSKSQGGGGDLKDEFLTEYNDVLLTTYLATLTKQLSSTNMVRSFITAAWLSLSSTNLVHWPTALGQTASGRVKYRTRHRWRWSRWRWARQQHDWRRRRSSCRQIGRLLLSPLVDCLLLPHAFSP